MAEEASIEKFVAIVGLPRSGTTLLTALLDAHPAACLYYEPWNASKKARPPVPRSLAEFRTLMERRFGVVPGARVRLLGFKETTILPESTAWATATIDALAAELPMHVIWIFRDPVLCLLSKIEGARKWWGYPDARFSADALVSYLRETEPSLRALDALVQRHGGLVVRYDPLVREPARSLEQLMAALGESFDPAQLDYHRAGPQPHKVMGDVEVAKAPAPVSHEREERRAAEAREHAEVVESIWNRPEFAFVRDTTRALLARGPVSRLGV